MDSGRYVDTRVTFPRTHYDFKSHLLASLEAGRPLPGYLLYSDLRAAHDWLTLSFDDDAFRRESAAVFERIDTVLGHGATAAAGYGLLAFGAGDGQKEARCARALATRGLLRECTVVDVCPYLLPIALHAIAGVLGDSPVLLNGVVPHPPYLAMLDSVLPARHTPRCLVLAGNTLGNSEEGALLDGLRNTLRPGDLLLVNVRKHSGTPVALAPYETAANRSHDFGPLRKLGVSYDPERMAYRQSVGLSGIPETVSVIATYDAVEIGTTVFRNSTLSVVHYYNEASFQCHLERCLCVATLCKEATDNSITLLMERG